MSDFARPNDFTRDECLKAARDADHVATHMADRGEREYHAHLADEWRARAATMTEK